MAGYNLPPGVSSLVTSNTDPDTLTICYNQGGCETTLSSDMPQPSSELKCASSVSCFSDGDWVYIYEPDSAIGEWVEISHVQEAAMHLQHNTMPLSRKYGEDSQVLRMTLLKYYIDTTTDPSHPTLMVQPIGQPAYAYADNISDLQFQYHMKNDSLYDQPAIVSDIKEVLISITGRTQSPDPDKSGNPYRQRTFATSINLRNQ